VVLWDKKNIEGVESGFERLTDAASLIEKSEVTTPVLIPFRSHAKHPRGGARLSRVAVIVLGEKVSRAVPTRIAVGVSDVIPLD
jgi:hypothetical protein